MEKKKKIGGIVALIAGIVLVLGSITTIIVIQVRKNKDDDEEIQEMDLPTATAHLQSSNTGGETSLTGGSSSVFTTEQIKVMQTYLLQLGIQHNNQYIIDAIQLTGGIDGKIGSGFHAAVKEARDRGYLTGYEDILRRLGYS